MVRTEDVDNYVKRLEIERDEKWGKTPENTK